MPCADVKSTDVESATWAFFFFEHKNDGVCSVPGFVLSTSHCDFTHQKQIYEIALLPFYTRLVLASKWDLNSLELAIRIWPMGLLLPPGQLPRALCLETSHV